MGQRSIGALLVLVTFLSWPSPKLAQFDCPNPWLPFEGKCYKFKILPTSYQDAVQDCARDGAGLISINSKAEHDFFSDYLIGNDKGNQEWFTSGKRREASDIDPRFFWEGDGTEIQGSQFWLRLRDRFSDGEIIVYITETGRTWGWTLRHQDVTRPYVCEISKEEIYKIIDTARGYDYGASEMDPQKLQRGPKFTQEPRDFIYDAASVDDFVTLECLAEGQPQPSYQWFKQKEQQQVMVTTAAERRYTITNGKLVINQPSDTLDNGDYQCVAENRYGSILSNQVQLSFGYLLDFPKSKRDDVTVAAYAGVGIECNPPKHYPEILYSWYKDSILNFVRPRLKPYIFISHNGKLYFSSVTKDDTGDYYCLVFSPRAGVSSAEGKVSMPIHLTVREAIASVREPQIASGFPTIFPSSPKQGDNVRLECFAWGTNEIGNLAYEWRREGKQMPENAYLEDYNRVLNIPDVRLIHAGTYRCTVTRVNGQSSTGTVQLPVEAEPFFTIPLRHAHVDLHGELRWLCIANGRPAPTYRWFRNTTQILPDQLPPEDRERIFIQNNVLTIKDVTEKDAGMYQCAASNLHGVRYSSAQLRVLSFAPTFDKYPMQPTTYATRRGNVTIICQPEAAPRAVKEWKKNGRVLNPSTEGTARIQLLPNGNLHIDGVTVTDKGDYTCIARNELGEAESSSQLLILSSTTISHFPRNTVVQVNHTAFLPCQASYNPLLDLTYLWYHNGRQVDFIRIRSISNEVYIEKDRYYSRGTGINRGGLYIESAKFELAGEYTCVARTASDRISHSANLQIIGPPGMPAGIFGSNVDATSIVITWVEGNDNGRPIISYTVEGLSNHEPFWKDLKTNIRGQDMKERRTKMTGLSPWTEYKFRIKAENSLGIGEPSIDSELYTTDEQPPQVVPENVGGGGGKVGDLVITWDPVPPIDQNGKNVYYMVYWKKRFVIDEEWSAVRVDGAESNRRVVLVGQNNYYSPYDVKVRVGNRKGLGPDPKESVPIMSAEDIPIGVATNVRSFSYNATALLVTWNPVPDTRDTIKGVLLGYRINFWKEDGEDETMSIYNIIPGQTDRGLVIGLEPHKYYYVNVQVYNSAGNGPKSQDYLEETLRSAPMNQPTEVHVKVVDHDSIEVDWRGVSTGIEEEPLQGYMVRIWRLGESIYHPRDIDSGKKTHYIVDDLEQNTYYNLRVYGYSRGGEGLMSSPTVQFVLGKSCNILETSPDRRFVYACDGCISSVSVLALLVAGLLQLVIRL